MVGLFPRRHANVVFAIHGFAIGSAAAVGNPYSGAGAHHRFQCRHQAAGGMLNFDPAIVIVLVDVRLAVRQNDDLLAMKVPVQCLFQAFRGPQSGSIFSIVGHAANQFAHVAQNGLKFPVVFSDAAQKTAQLQTPAISRPLGHKHGHSKGHEGQEAGSDEQECPRLGFPPFDKTQVVHQDCEAQILVLDT